LEKKPQEFALEYAGFWVRLGAGVIDLAALYVIYGIIFGSIFWIISSVFAPSGQASMAVFSPPLGDMAFGYGFLTVPIVWGAAWLIEIAYYVGFWTWRGQTPGKMVVGIKVIRTDSSPITLAYAFLRYLGCVVSVVILFIGFIWIAFDGRKQGIHDKIADTYVVKLPVKQVAFTGSYARGQVGYV
jgi:uncharacterized RDD family membrane protein YckC